MLPTLPAVTPLPHVGDDVPPLPDDDELSLFGNGAQGLHSYMLIRLHSPLRDAAW